jgi:hypothetical protein
VLKKNISDYSTSAYKDLCNSVRKNFKAILAKQGNVRNSLGIVNSAITLTIRKNKISFSA